MASTYYNAPSLPWTPELDDDRRFRRIVAVVVGVTLLLGVLMPLVPVSERESDSEDVPPRLARLVIEQREPEPRPEPRPEPEEQAEPEPEPEPEPETKTEPERKPEPPPEPKSTVEKAREKASKSGVLAFSDDLADLEERDVSASVSSKESLSREGATASETERDVVTSRVDTGSQGIDSSGLSRDSGAKKTLQERETTRVESPEPSGEQNVASRTREQQSAGIRSDEAIQLVFDRHKSAFYRLYRRALRKNPSLQGTVVVKLTIAPSGQVTDAEVVSSELGDASLERRIELRVMQLDFGARQVKSTTVEYPIDFFPS